MSGNICICGYRCLFRHAHGERKPSVRSRTRYSKISCYSEREKNVQGCVSQNSDPMNFDSTKIWRIGIERFGGTHLKFFGCTWYKIEFGSKKVKLMSEILARPVWGTTTWGNLTTSRLYKQSSVEFGEKICKLKAEDNYVLVSCEGAEDSGASMHNAEQRRIKLKFDGYFEQVQNPISDLPRLWTVQINE